jgi:hypothetical protein
MCFRAAAVELRSRPRRLLESGPPYMRGNVIGPAALYNLKFQIASRRSSALRFPYRFSWPKFARTEQKRIQESLTPPPLCATGGRAANTPRASFSRQSRVASGRTPGAISRSERGQLLGLDTALRQDAQTYHFVVTKELVAEEEVDEGFFLPCCHATLNASPLTARARLGRFG